MGRYPRGEVEASSELIAKHKVTPLTVGQRVLAVHPKTGELKTGSILTSDYGKFDVRFDNPDLGIELIPDFSLIPISESTSPHSR